MTEQFTDFHEIALGRGVIEVVFGHEAPDLLARLAPRAHWLDRARGIHCFLFLRSLSHCLLLRAWCFWVARPDYPPRRNRRPRRTLSPLKPLKRAARLPPPFAPGHRARGARISFAWASPAFSRTPANAALALRRSTPFRRARPGAEASCQWAPASRFFELWPFSNAARNALRWRACWPPAPRILRAAVFRPPGAFPRSRP